MDIKDKKTAVFNSSIGPIAEALEKNRGKPLEDIEINFFYQNTTKPYEQVKRPKKWVEDYIESVAHLNKDSELFTQLFYIKLDGILSEMSNFYKNNIMNFNEEDLKIFELSLAGKYTRNIMTNIESFKILFTEQELIYIDIQRNLASHLNPNGFYIKIVNRKDQTKPNLDDQYKKSDKFGKVVTAEDVSLALKNINDLYLNPLGFAKHISSKTYPQLEQLLMAFNKTPTGN